MEEKRTVTIKPGKLANQRVILSFLCILFPVIIMLVILLAPEYDNLSSGTLQNIFLVLCFLEIVLILNFVLCWAKNGKTYVLDKEGLTVRFLKYKRKYLWNELKAKRIENYTKSVLRGYSEGVIFSTTDVNSTNFMSAPIRYEIKHFFIPLALPFFIDFKENNPKAYSPSMIYQVDKEEFLNSMSKLEVSI